MALVFKRERVSIKDITHIRCMWDGCDESSPIDHLADGWRLLVIAKGSLFKKENLMTADRDGALCPAHVKMIDELFFPLPTRKPPQNRDPI